MKPALFSFCLALALAPAWGQVPTDDVGSGDFPALQLLPPGSVIKGISLPRYENHRVSSLITASMMTIQTRSSVLLSTIKASLYGEDGSMTTVICPAAGYDFHTKTIQSDTEVQVQHPRFTAKGQGVIFDTSSHYGLLKGPVHTTISSSAFKQ